MTFYIDFDNGHFFRKVSISANSNIPEKGTVFISVNNQDKLNIIPIARDLYEMGFNILATSGTAKELGATGALGKIEMDDYDYNDLAVMVSVWKVQEIK